MAATSIPSNLLNLVSLKKDTSDPTIIPCTLDINARLTPHANPGLYSLDFVNKDGCTRYSGNTRHIGVFCLGNIGDRTPTQVKTPLDVMCKTRPPNSIDLYVLNVRGMYEIRTPDGNSVKFAFIVTKLTPVTVYRVVFHVV